MADADNSFVHLIKAGARNCPSSLFEKLSKLTPLTPCLACKTFKRKGDKNGRSSQILALSPCHYQQSSTPGAQVTPICRSSGIICANPLERMSFLPARLAASEGAFFKEHSKQAALALREKLKSSAPASSKSETILQSSQADILPEVLRHSLPIAPTAAELQAYSVTSTPVRSSLAASLQSVLKPRTDTTVRTGIPSIEAVDHLASVPQTSFGRKKWIIDATDVEMVASTANASRVAKNGQVDEKAVMEGLFVVTKAFAVATGLVFGGSAIAASVTASRHEIKSLDDVRTKGREYFTPRVEQMKQRFKPLKSWADQKTESWKIEETRRRAIGSNYAKSLGLQQAEFEKSKGQ